MEEHHTLMRVQDSLTKAKKGQSIITLLLGMADLEHVRKA